MSKKNIIFDMGGVIPSRSIGVYNKQWCANEEESKWVMKNIIHSVEWVMTDRGTMTDEDAIASICARVPEEYHDLTARYLHEFRRQMDPNPAMESLITDLKSAGYKIYLFSNVGYRHEEFFEYLPAMKLMDGLWCSCDYKVIKPEPAAYQSLFEKFALDPSECIFIDDKEENIEQGIRQGMDGIVYHGDVAELREELKNREIRVK